MNENQTTYPTGAQDEEEIDLVALMVTLLHKLKPILLTAVVCAVLFGGFAGIKAIRGADKDTLKAQRLEDEEYQQKSETMKKCRPCTSRTWTATPSSSKTLPPPWSGRRSTWKSLC